MRVIAGIAKGRPLRSIESSSVRPTADKVKGAIFSILESAAYKQGLVEPGYIARAEEGELAFPWRTVLDLYAGSGALGIEALSRGAETVDFVEADPRARAAIVENLKRTGLVSRARIHGMRVEQAISTFTKPYDLILLDPPYNDPGAESAFRQLCESALVGPATYLVLEHSRQRSVPTECGSLTLVKTRFHGRTGISLYAAGQQE